MKMCFAIVVLFSAIGQHALAESTIKKGLWEVTAQMEMQGFPFTPPPVTTQQCFDKDNAVPKSAQQDENCDVSQKQVNDNTVSWTLVCLNERGELKGNGEISYKDDTFNGFLKMVLKSKEGQLNMDSTLKGRYLGACPK